MVWSKACFLNDRISFYIACWKLSSYFLAKYLQQHTFTIAGAIVVWYLFMHLFNLVFQTKVHRIFCCWVWEQRVSYRSGQHGLWNVAVFHSLHVHLISCGTQSNTGKWNVKLHDSKNEQKLWIRKLVISQRSPYLDYKKEQWDVKLCRSFVSQMTLVDVSLASNKAGEQTFTVTQPSSAVIQTTGFV